MLFFLKMFFQLFKNVETILRSQDMQRQTVGSI